MNYDSLKSSYKFEDMAFTKLRSVYFQRTGTSFNATDYESFGIVDTAGNLTNAGALLADESPLRHSRLFCTRWNGNTKAGGLIDALDDAEYTGSLITLLQEGLAFIGRNIRKAWKKTPTSRLEMPDYPERAYMEALVNALIHRNYLELGSEVHIDIFDDRLEIYSPGGMIDGSTLKGKNLLTIPSRRRNPVLADIFSRLKYMERRGSGFKKIIGAYAEEKEKPLFKTDFEDFIIVLPNVNYGTSNEPIADEEELQKWRAEIGIPPFMNVDSQATRVETRVETEEMGATEPVTRVETRERIIKLISENPIITTSELASQLSISIKGVEWQLKKLKAEGRIIRIGARKNGHWKVVK